MNIRLVDFLSHTSLLPLTFTKSVADLRVGILTIKEKWSYYSSKIDILTEDYLQELYDLGHSADYTINASIIPNESLVNELASLKINQALYNGAYFVAAKGVVDAADDLTKFDRIQLKASCRKLNRPQDIFLINGDEIKSDIKLFKPYSYIDEPKWLNKMIGDDVYIESGAKLRDVTLNSENGPIFLGKNSEIMEGSVIRGPFALCEGSVVKMNSKMYGDSTIGPYCKVGGEITNSIFQGYSNKGHDGFLGNSVVGEWCNLGADTNNSNLKNNYGNVKAWDYSISNYIDTGLQFCGLIIGDHSKSAINTMFNTGTVVGICANIFQSGFPSKFIKSFSWGQDDVFDIEKAIEVAKIVMSRRKRSLTTTEEQILRKVFQMTR